MSKTITAEQLAECLRFIAIPKGIFQFSYSPQELKDAATRINEHFAPEPELEFSPLTDPLRQIAAVLITRDGKRIPITQVGLDHIVKENK